MERFYANPVTMAGIINMQTTLLVNDRVIPLNDFTQSYLGNVIKGMVAALGQDSENIRIYIDESGLKIYTEAGEVPFAKDFAKLLIESTIKGMLSPLKGIFWLSRVSISCKKVKGKVSMNN